MWNDSKKGQWSQTETEALIHTIIEKSESGDILDEDKKIN